eukprot:m.71729 g.71729  ORF g.71729 m.71729 type:complete len:440 (-) comp12960_c0_seq1:26-1345(-)
MMIFYVLTIIMCGGATASLDRDEFRVALSSNNATLLGDVVRRSPQLLKAKNFYSLHEAVKVNNSEACELLSPLVEDVNAYDEHGRTALHYAAENRDPCLEILLRHKANVTLRTLTHDFDPVILVAANGTARGLEMLGAAGANLSACDVRGSSALHFATLNPLDAAAVVSALLEAGADPAGRNTLGETPLHWAAMSGAVGAMQELLAAGADPAATCEGNRTVLHVAIEAAEKDSDVVAVLISAGADPRVRDGMGVTALQEAIVFRKDEAAAAIIAACVLGERDCADTHPRTLHMAAYHGLPETVSLLCEAGADAAALSPAGKSTLHAAAEGGSASVIALLLSGPAAVHLNTATRDGDTPLHVAARRGHVEVARVLLDAGADRSLLTKKFFFNLFGGETAAQVATRAGHTHVASLIETHVVVSPQNEIKGEDGGSAQKNEL